MIVDAHHHLWDPARADYPWMTDELAAIRRRFGPEDLAPLVDEHGVDRTVVVQTRSSVDETRELLATSAATPFIAGVVGWVDLRREDVGEAIADLRAGEGGDRLVGIRHQVHDEDDPGWLLRPDVARGLEAVGRTGLVYDLLVRPRELPAAAEAARRHPELTFVVDHLAKPPIATGAIEPWATGLSALAALPNVHCKLSGLVTEARWADWSVDDLQPYARRALELFGDERLLWGSDWPVCLLAASYGQVADAYVAALGDVPAGQLARIRGGNAARVYALDGRG